MILFREDSEFLNRLPKKSIVITDMDRLPEDLLRCVIGMGENSALVCMRAVCKTWLAISNFTVNARHQHAAFLYAEAMRIRLRPNDRASLQFVLRHMMSGETKESIRTGEKIETTEGNVLLLSLSKHRCCAINKTNHRCTRKRSNDQQFCWQHLQLVRNSV